MQFSGQNVDTNFSYLNMPVVGKLYLAGGFNLQLGPQFGFLTGATGSISSSNGPVTTRDIRNNLKGSDISIAMGAGFDLPMKLSIDARYNLGVSDINNSTSSSTIKNQVIQISVGYKLFNLGN